MRLVLIGPTNSGKGTLSRNLRDTFPEMAYFSTGSMFRRLIKEGDATAISLQEDYFSKGKNGPDSITLELLRRELGRLSIQNLIIDGYPRNVSQARTLDEILPGVIPLYLGVRDELLLSRARDRVVCSDESCARVYNYVSNPSREMATCDDCYSPLEKRDDDPNLLVKRIEDFRYAFKEISPYYGSRLIEVNGEKTPKEVLIETVEALKAMAPVTLKKPLFEI